MVDSSGKKVKRKQATLKTRKSIGSGYRSGGGGDSDDDDEDEARQRPPPKMRAPPAPATKLLPKAKSCSDVEMAEEDRHSRPSQPKKTSAAKTRKESDDEDSGDDLVRRALEVGKSKATATAAQASKRKS